MFFRIAFEKPIDAFSLFDSGTGKPNLVSELISLKEPISESRLKYRARTAAKKMTEMQDVVG